ncbi:DNA-formamidopyrimidine glycosylase [Aliidiomarina minuta]|uniref:Formamidopyrimidine-DNA glycosylase n=1 Tax=Aliidiomarina minuta TaxID=880057 RepID=A0A432W9Y6_9GAMM|nr:bifunctional DNA-formamidopyrimidine glycosylase/DNA-(apurinic or apyrimidinic site) lyase [Aliidiomarina minuta]RUO26796.1 DNA-formamidopyrimidine glycosylase [Aliidiomarina minuta]
MPELPEVEVSRLGIEPHVVGQRITAVKVHHPRLRWPIPESVHKLKGQVVVAIERRAKYLLLESAIGTLILHLGMSGSLRVVPVATERGKHDHFELVLSSEQCLRLNDPRRFGAVLWQEPDESELSLFSNLGPEPLTDDFSGELLYQRSRSRKSPVKTFIMDNANVVGVGNIYATEALFAAGVDPRRAAGRISRARYQLLAQHIKRVLARAIQQGGTSLRDFTRADGKPGYFKQELLVYGRTGQPCVNCATELKTVQLGQRRSVYCPDCQR